MSEPVSTPKSSGTISGFNTTRMHSSIDLEAVSAASLSASKTREIDHFESAYRVLEHLRRRIG